MQTYIFADIKHFCIDKKVFYKTEDGITILNAPNGIGEVLDQNFKNFLGWNGLAAFKNEWPFAYIDWSRTAPYGDIDSNGIIDVDINAFKILLHSFISFLWFAKDNSVFNHFLYARATDEQATIYGSAMSLESHTNSLGKHQDIFFSQNEIQYCDSIRRKFKDIHKSLIRLDKKEIKLSEALQTFKKFNGKPPEEYNTYSRIRLAFEHINAARGQYYLPAKIGSYMSFFETLFSTDSEAVNYKVSERVAFYVTSDKKERVDIFDKIRSAYDIRSKYFHGGKIKKNQVKLESMQLESQYIDELARKVFTKIITEDSDIFMQGQDEHVQYLKMLIFS